MRLPVPSVPLDREVAGFIRNLARDGILSLGGGRLFIVRRSMPTRAVVSVARTISGVVWIFLNLDYGDARLYLRALLSNWPTDVDPELGTLINDAMDPPLPGQLP